MSGLNLAEFDKEYLDKGYSLIVGIDEVGRGALAGPVVACAVILPRAYNKEDINDSKQLTFAKRKELSEIIKADAIDYAFGVIDADKIDEINILNATKLAMKQAVDKLKCDYDLILIDAIKDIGAEKETIGIIKGDAKSQSIAAASILAKVYRDELMIELDKTYPIYGFKHNMGYGTPEHIEAINKFGPIKHLHRFSFSPVATINLF